MRALSLLRLFDQTIRSTLMECPLCGHSKTRHSWVGPVIYLDRAYNYLQCGNCRSHFCHPMPSEEVLGQMYDVGYRQDFASNPDIKDPKEPQRVYDWLSRLKRGRFLDYGCGEGELLRQAHQLGWEAIGIEFDPEVAKDTSRRTGLPVIGIKDAGMPSDVLADCLHLGDVIEHLTELPRQMPAILELLKPGGIVLAQGPLEANACLYTFLIQLKRRIHQSPVYMAPGHVLLATSVGQRQFFQRFGLKELEYRLSEVSWPAPDRLSASDLVRPGKVAKFVARRMSLALSRLWPNRLGNRYFYVGRKPG